MYPLLSTRRRVLLSLLILGGRSTYSSIKSFLPIGYFGPKFYAMLKRLESDGLIKRFHRPSSIVHHPSIRLLPAGLELLERRFGPRLRNLTRVATQGTETGWSLVILNFPTDQAYSRSRLVGRLVELGCGCLRDGAYVSPYPILDVVAQWAEENNCLNRIFLSSLSPYPLALIPYSAAWDFPGLTRRYLSLLDRLAIAKSIPLPPKRARAQIRIKSDFLDLLISDPLLPKPFLPADYPLARVIGEITNLDKNISTDEIKIDNLPGKKSIKNTTKTEAKPLEK